MTLLAMIPRHKLYFFCTCGHTSQGVSVAELLEQGKRDWRVEDVRSRARCSRCGQVKQSEVRIVYDAGGSPMSGSATDNPSWQNPLDGA